MSNQELVTEFSDLVGNAGIFGLTFVKADDTIRTGAFRLGVSRGVTGHGMSYNAAEKGILVAFDMNAQGHRSIRLDRVTQVRAHGMTIDV